MHPPALPRALRERAEPFRAERPRTVGWAIAACVAARTEVLRRLGPFEPRQFLFFEDMDLCLRARAAGVPTVLDPGVRVRHLGGHATRRAYAGEPHELLARRRREVVLANRGRVALALDDAAQALTFATRAAARRATGREAQREQAQLAAVLRGIRAPGHNDARCRSACCALQTATPSSRWCARAASCTGRGPTRPSAPTSSTSCCRAARAEDFACFVVIDDESGDIAGVFNISQIVRGSFQSAFLGYYGSARHAGKGLMREGLQLVLDYAFGPLSLHRIEANIQPGNAASIALARGAGFRLEGYSPRYLLIGGQWRDHERYALTVDERASRRG